MINLWYDVEYLKFDPCTLGLGSTWWYSVVSESAL